MINCNPNCPNVHCEGGVITYNGSTGKLCRKCNPLPKKDKDMIAEKVINLTSGPAPIEWTSISGIKKAKPVGKRNAPMRLERFKDTNLCAWYRLNSPYWTLASDIYIVNTQ